MTSVTKINISGVNFKAGVNRNISATTKDDNHSDDKKMKTSTKVMLGATALAATVLGGFLIAKSLKKGKLPEGEPAIDELTKKIDDLKDQLWEKHLERVNAEAFHDMERKIADKNADTVSRFLFRTDNNAPILFVGNFENGIVAAGVEESYFEGGKLVNKLNKKPSCPKELYLGGSENSEEGLLSRISAEQDKIDFENNNLTSGRKFARALIPAYFSEEFKELRNLIDPVCESGAKLTEEQQTRANELMSAIRQNVVKGCKDNGITLKKASEATPEELEKYFVSSKNGQSNVAIYDESNGYIFAKGTV